MWAMTRSIFPGANAAPVSYYIRKRKIQKACYDAAITILCGFMTFMALRSCFEGGKLRTPMDDLHDIQRVSQAFAHVRKQLIISNPALDPDINHGIAQKSEPETLPNANTHPSNSDHSHYVLDQNSKPIGGANPSLSTIPNDHSAVTNNQSDPNSSMLDSIPRDQLSPAYDLLLVTGSQPSPCLTSQDTRLLLLSLKNKLDYCRIHGIKMMYDVHVHTHTHPKARLFGKLSTIMDLMLSNSEAQWFWWVDNDALFTNMSIMLPMEKYTNAEYNMVILQGLDDQERELEELEEGAESAKIWGTKSFLLRNCAWSIDLISTHKGLAVSEWEGGKAGSSDVFDQLIKQKSSKWSNKVYVETSARLQASRDGAQEAEISTRERTNTRRANVLEGRQQEAGINKRERTSTRRANVLEGRQQEAGISKRERTSTRRANVLEGRQQEAGISKRERTSTSRVLEGRQWVGKSSAHESSMVGRERPLLTHLVGCKLCGNAPIDEPCTRQMEAAFRAANNDEALQL